MIESISNMTDERLIDEFNIAKSNLIKFKDDKTLERITRYKKLNIHSELIRRGIF